LPVDPINEFSSCPAGYDPDACWNDTTKDFVCEDGSHIYQYYSVIQSGNPGFLLWANLELDSINWSGFGRGQDDSCQDFAVGP
jgi:hypothetical protein